MTKKLYPYRFEIFFFSQIAILFGTLIVPSVLFESIFSPILFIINILAGILLISQKKKLTWLFIVLILIAVFIFGSDMIDPKNREVFSFIRMGIYFLFYNVVTYEIIKQVWNAVQVNKNVIFGLVSGYISLGMIGFFICLSIEMANPNSFQLAQEAISNPETMIDSLMYFSYITLLTIGYGDILPITTMAHKATMLIGLVGQIYLVVITAIVVGKYINQANMSLK